MKAIIIAGGLGTRLMPYTKEIPKCMIDIRGAPLLERQIKTFQSCGINEIIVLKGHLAEKIQSPGITRSYKDPNWVRNMVNALFSAEQELEDIDDSIIISYGDILFDEETLRKVLKCDKDICVAVDDNWKEYWKARFNGNLEDTESLQIGEMGNITELGTPDPPIEQCHSRYLGLIKFSKRGVEILRKVYHKNKKEYWDKDFKWLNSKSFQQAYMTDMLQAIINSGYDIWPVHILGGWMEFDTANDYELFLKWFEEGSLNRFYNLRN